MSDPAPLCPGCRAPLVAEGRYCVQCGLEVCQHCPGCGGARRMLSTLHRSASPWCESCDRLLAACERCGRWLLPHIGRCPDPQCGGRVVSPYPLQTGRRWDGSEQSGWKWPIAWERENPEHTAPRVDWWTSHGEVQAAFVAHGRCFVWETNTLVIPDERGGWTSREGAGAPGGVSWRSPLPIPLAQSAKVPADERVAVLGGRVIMATESGYAQADLRHTGDSSLIWAARPLTQVAGPANWVAWGTEGDESRLRTAAIPVDGAPIQVESIPVPSEATLANRGRLVLRDGRAFWPGRDGAVWELELSTRTVRCARSPVDGLLDLWVGADGPRIVREGLGQLTVALTGPRESSGGLTVPAGAGPLRGVYGLDSKLVVAGDRVITFDTRTGDRLHEALRPPGVWISAVLVRTPDQEPRLVSLTREGGFASVMVTRLSSGVHDLLWREATLEPKTLLPVVDSLYLVHSRGLLRFRI